MSVGVCWLVQFRGISLAATIKPANDSMMSALVRPGGTNDVPPSKQKCGGSDEGCLSRPSGHHFGALPQSVEKQFPFLSYSSNIRFPIL